MHALQRQRLSIVGGVVDMAVSGEPENSLHSLDEPETAE